MGADLFDYFPIKLLKPLTLILLFFVLCAAMLHQTQYYSAVTTTALSEIPIYCVDTHGDKNLSITFDSAWGTEDLPEILSILDKHNCIATFFVTGEWATRYPEAIQAIARAGHLLGNHGANHKHMTTLDNQEMLAEIQGCHDIIRQQTNLDMHLFRAPYGDYNEAVVAVAKSLGYYTIQWDVDSLDWKDYGTDSIIQTVCEHKHLSGGSIILLHNGSTYTKSALDALLTRLENDGYHFVSLSELLIKGDYQVDYEGRMHEKK